MNIPSHIQPILYVVAMAAVCWILMKRNGNRLEKSRRESRRFDPRPTPNTISNAAPSSAISLNNSPAEVSRWTIELFDQMRDWQGELNSKSLVLQSLLKMAQEETARLEHCIAELRSAPGSIGQPRAMPEAYPEMVAYETRSSLHSIPLIDSQLIERAHRFATQEMSIAEIAQRLKKSIGDTELLLSLAPRTVRHSEL